MKKDEHTREQLRNELGKALRRLAKLEAKETERKHVEEALREREERFRRLAENAQDLIFRYELSPQPRFTYVSPAARVMTGYTPAQYYADPDLFFKLPLPPDRPLVEAAARGAIPPGNLLILRWVRKDGRILWTEQRIVPIHDAAGNLVAIEGIARDITDRKQMEEALRESEERFRRLAENAQDLIFRYELSPQPRFTYVSPTARVMTGYTPAQYYADPDLFFKLPLPPDRPLVEAAARGVIPPGNLLILRWVRKDGRILWTEQRIVPIHDAAGNLVAIEGIARDITDRKQMEEALRESEERFRRLAENAQDLIFRYELSPQPRFTYVSPTATSLVGYTPEEHYSDPHLHFKIVHPDDRPLLEALNRGDLPPDKPLILRWVRKDGRVIWAEGRNVLIRNQAGKVVAVEGISRDITDRVQAEEALRKSEEDHRLYFENVSDVIYCLDPDFIVLSVSPSVERALGYQPEELIGRPFYELGILTPESLERALSDARRVLAGERISSAEYEFIATDGKKRIGEVSGSPIFREGKVVAILSVGRDVTERKQMEEALRESEERFRRLAENAQDLIYRYELSPQPRFTYVSPAARVMTGYTPEEFYADPDLFLKLTLPHDRPYLEAAARGVIPPGNLLILRWVCKDKEGMILWTEHRLVPIHDPAGNLVAIEGIARDITERKQMEGALRSAEAKYRSLVEEIPVVAYTAELDEDRTTLYIGPQIEGMFGFSPGEWMANPELWLKQIHPQDRERVRAEYQEVRTTGKTFASEYRLRSSDGRMVWVHDQGSILRGENDRPQFIKGVMSDITERKSLEQVAFRESALRRGINKILQETLHCETEQEVARVCLSTAEELTGSQFGFIGEVNQAGRFDATALSDPGWQSCRIPKPDSAALLKDMEIRGFWGRVLKEETSQIVNDPASDPDRLGTPKGHPPITSFLGVPLRHEGKVFGMIALANKESGYDLADRAAIEDLSIAFVEALERKRAEHALRESEAGLSAIMQRSPDGIYLGDIETKRILETNKAFQQLLGYFPEELAGMHIYDIVAADPKDIDDGFQKALSLKGEVPFDHERKYRRKDGSLVQVWVRGTTLTYQGREVMCTFVRDLTDRKRAEQALRESEERYRAVVEQSADGIYLVDPESKCLLLSNTAFQNMIGYGPEETRQLSLYDFIAADREDIERRFQKVLIGKTPLAFERKFRKRDGSLLDVWVSGNVVLFGGREVVCGIARDITERKQMEETLRESSDHLRSLATRLAEVEEAERRHLARELHDRLGQNLTAVNINLSMVRSQLCGKSSPDVDARLEDCMKLVEETMDCTRDVMAELRPPVMDDYGLLASLQWYGKRFSDNTGVTVVVEGNELTPRLPLSMEISLFRVAQEAMTNVAKHAHATQVTVRLEDAEEVARLTIADNGDGFDPTHLSRPTEERGWGLMCMKERMEGVGGRCYIESYPGQGTRVVAEAPKK